MEAERQKFEAVGKFEKGKLIGISGDRAVGPVERFEFGAPNDEITAVIGGGYTSHWNPDFLQRDLGRDGTCSRFYYDCRMVLDIGDPESKIARVKRKLLFRHGFGYLCVPPGFPQEGPQLRKLYKAALAEYQEYERRHPRPIVLQETTIIDSKGHVRSALVSAIDTKVGGGVIGSVEQQQAELKHATKLSKKEVKFIKLRSKLHRKLRRSLQSGIPFRNPFIAPNKRKYPVQYSE